MLCHKVQGAGGLSRIKGLVGYAQTKTTSAVSSLDVDVSGIDIRPNDLGIFVCGFRSGNTNALSGWTADYEGNRVEAAHKSFSGGETTVTITGTDMDDGAALVFVYRSFSFTSFDFNLIPGSTGGMPDSPPLTMSVGDRSFIAGFLDDDIITMTAPSGYSLIVADSAGVTDAGNSYAAAEKVITSSGTEDPAVWGGAGDDLNIAFTYALSPT